MKYFIIALTALATLCTPHTGRAQGIFYSRKAAISFFSKAPIEDIQADNNNVLCIMDMQRDKLQLEVLIKAFGFEKKLMQEHFNENYLESDKYPKASFKGQFSPAAGDDPSKEGEHKVKIKGDLTIHGVTRPVEAEAVLVVNGNKVSASSGFSIQLSDYNIKIPKLVIDNISNQILLKIQATLEPYK